MKLQNKVIVITGGAGLLGREIAQKISDEGGIAVITDVNIEAAQKYSDLISGSMALELDIASKKSCLDVINTLKAKYGRVDGLVNSAYPRNRNYGRNFVDVEYDDFNENVSLNLGGYFLTSQCFSIYFKNNGGGSIVNISSIYGVVAPKFDIYENTKMTMPVEYSVIKSGLIHLTKYIAAFINGSGVRVNCVSPGGLLAGQPEVFLEKYKSNCLSKGMLEAKDITGAISFLLSDESTYINGQNIIVDDGFCL